MADDDQIEDIPPPHPFFIRAEYPFVFIPQTDEVIEGDNQTTSEKKTNDDEEEESEEMVEDEGDRNDLRISQPEYSQLLKELDFSRTRMVDVTNLLADEKQSLSSESNVEIEKDENFINAANDIQNQLNYSAEIIEDASERKPQVDEDDDTSKQATQNYDLQEEIVPSTKSDPNARFTSQEENLSSIPRLNTSASYRKEDPISWENLLNGTEAYIQPPTVVIISQPFQEVQTTPTKQQPSASPPKEQAKPHVDPPSKQKLHYRSRQLSSSSDGDSVVGEHVVRRMKQNKSQPPLSAEEDFQDFHTHLKQSLVDGDRPLSAEEDFQDLHTHLKQSLVDGDRPCTTASDILIRRLSDRTSPSKKKSHHHHRSSTVHNENYLAMFEKLERDHKERLEKQQKQYEDYMHHLEEKMKQRFEDYLSSNNSFQESRTEISNEPMHVHRVQTSVSGRGRTSTTDYQYRPLARDFNLSRSHSREDISTCRTELSAKHDKHISDLKLYYDHEIEQLKNELNRSKMGHTSSSTTRQSIETIERINSENIRLHDEMKELRQLLRKAEEDNRSLRRQLEEIREQVNRKDADMKNFHRGVTDLEKQLAEAQNAKERLDEKVRYADRQVLIYREENEKINNELNLTKERLLRLEERYHDLDNEKKTHRSTVENHQYPKVVADDPKLSSTMSLNIPTSREYGRFTLTTSKFSSSTISSSRETNLDSGRYATNGSDDLFRHENSPRSILKISDYLNDKPTYVPPSRPLYSPSKTSPNHQMDFIDHQIKQSEQLEGKFDELLRKKRDLESRINRIPTRGLTNTDRQLLDVLEREIERVEQQISSVKLELRKLNVLPTH